MARRSEHSQEEIKEMVLKAAETIVIEEGFSGLKVRKIAMEIGYTVGSVYMVFNNMADLNMHIKGRTLDDLTEQLNQISTNDDPAKMIEQLASIYLTFANQHFNRWRMLFDFSSIGDDTVPNWYQDKVDHIFGIVEFQFNQLSTSYTDEQTKQASRALWSGVHGICILSASGKMDLLGIKSIEGTVMLLVKNFIKGWKL